MLTYVIFRNRLSMQARVSHQNNNYKIAVIGLGPRGLGVLERIIAYVKYNSEFLDKTFELHLFDPNLPGTGCHGIQQPDYLLVNTIASQITMFSDESVNNAGPVHLGPSFYEWLLMQKNEKASPDEYYPRSLFGRYLNWVFEHLLTICPPNIHIYHHQSKVNCIYPEKSRWLLCYEENDQSCQIVADFIYLTTGHSKKKLSSSELKLQSKVQELKKVNYALQIIFDPYPIQKSLQSIEKSCTVAIEGAGLTACDILAELTIGRGGEFQSSTEGLAYIPSGKEPNISIFSRSGLPLTARAKNQKGVTIQYRARFLTIEQIKELKEQSSSKQLDFYQEILPLLLLDMQYAYYFAYIKNKKGEEAANKFCSNFINAKNEHDRAELVSKYVLKKYQFSWERILNPIPKYATRNIATFRRWLLQYLKDDITQAKLGNIDSPIKAACDVIRDLRDILRYAVDFAGLTPDSYAGFMKHFVPLMNRLAVGPPVQRIEELVALINAGIVRFDYGPSPSCRIDEQTGHFDVKASYTELETKADVLVQARISLPTPTEDESELMRCLLQQSIVTPNEGAYTGIHVDTNLNVINQKGESIRTIWAIGIPTEGCKFYTFVAPRPGINSTFIVDSGGVVNDMMEQIKEAPI